VAGGRARRLAMNNSQPTGPKNNTITSHPTRGLNGQRVSFGARHGPNVGDSATCSSGIRKLMTINQATTTGLTGAFP
jgi:hypothetical protein